MEQIIIPTDESDGMTGLRILKKRFTRPTNEWGATEEYVKEVLQFHAGQHGWMDVPIIEDLPSNNLEEK